MRMPEVMHGAKCLGIPHPDRQQYKSEAERAARSSIGEDARRRVLVAAAAATAGAPAAAQDDADAAAVADDEEEPKNKKKKKHKRQEEAEPDEEVEEAKRAGILWTQWGDFPWHVLKDPETTKSKLAHLGPGEFYDADVCQGEFYDGAAAADTESEWSIDHWHGTTCENAASILRTGFKDLPYTLRRTSQVPPHDLLHGVFGSQTFTMATRYATRYEEGGLRKKSLFDHGIIIHSKVSCTSRRRWTNGKTCDNKQSCYAASDIRVCSVRFLRARGSRAAFEVF